MFLKNIPSDICVLIETYWNVKIPRYFDPFFEIEY